MSKSKNTKRGTNHMAKTKTERIDSIGERIAQLENQRKQLIQKQKEDERKARTRRLIQRGAILEGFIPDAETYTEDEIQTFLKETLATDFARKALRRLKPPQQKETAPAKPTTTPQGTAPAPAGESGCTEGTG